MTIFRNSNGFSIAGKFAVVTGLRTEVRPKSEALRRSPGLPINDRKLKVGHYPEKKEDQEGSNAVKPAEIAGSEFDQIVHVGLNAFEAAEIAALACQPVKLPPKLLNQRSNAQSLKFLKAAKAALRSLGVGRGSTPSLSAPFEPFNKPKSGNGPADRSRLRNVLPWVSRPRAADSVKREKKVDEKPDDLYPQSLVAMREAIDLEAALSGKLKQHDQAIQWFQDGIENYGKELEELKKRRNDIEDNKLDISVGAKLEVDRITRAISEIEGFSNNHEVDKPNIPVKLNSDKNKRRYFEVRKNDKKDHLGTDEGDQYNLGQIRRLQRHLTKLQTDGAKVDKTNLGDGSPEVISFSQNEIENAQKAIEDAKAQITNRVNALAEAPPGFSPGKDTTKLTLLLKDLAQRIEQTPLGLSEKEETALRRDRAPSDRVMEIVSRYLAQAAGGDVDKAEQALKELMKRSFAGLVPKPGRDFSGERVYLGKISNDSSSIEKRFISAVADTPGGVELLKRLVQPGPKVPPHLRDAVTVYYRADRVLVEGKSNIISFKRLHSASQAAKLLAHPSSAASISNADSNSNAAPSPYQTLSREQRIDFNAVRNGFTEFGKDSDFAKANAAVVKFSNQWVPRAGKAQANKTPKDNEANDALNNDEAKTTTHRGGVKKSPLAATQRRFAAKVAADLHFPTLERLLHKHLVEACEGIQKIIAIELVEARKQVVAARANPMVKENVPASEVVKSLQHAKSMVDHIKECADSGKRIDTLKLRPRHRLVFNYQASNRAQAELSLSTSKAQWLGNDKDRFKTSGHDASQVDVRQATNQPSGVIDVDQLEEGRSGINKPTQNLSQKLSMPSPGQAILETLDALFKALPHSPPVVDDKPNQSAEAAEKTAKILSEIWTAPGKILEEASAIKKDINQFLATNDGFSAEALEKWILPALLDRSEQAYSETTKGGSRVIGTPEYGTITFNHATQYGFNLTTLLSGIAGVFTGGLGWVVRPEFERIYGPNNQVRFGRDASGMSILIGEAQERSTTLGASAALLFSPNKVPALGPAASLMYVFTKSKLKGGVVIRVPRFDDKSETGEIKNPQPNGKTDGSEDKSPPPSSMGDDFKEIIKTLVEYNSKATVDAVSPPYASPLDALLDNHEAISITTVDKETTKGKLNSSRIGVFYGPLAKLVGRSAFFFSTMAGVENSSLQERRSFKTKGGAQGYWVNTKLAKTDTAVALTGVFRHGYVQKPESNINGARGDLASWAFKSNHRVSSALVGCNLISQPDGTIIRDQSLEYSNFEKFEAAVNSHREKWIEKGIEVGNRDNLWHKDLSEAEKRIQSEKALNEFLESARQSSKSNTVTFNENLDLKPEVSSLICSNIALEHLALRQGREDEVKRLQDEREYILSQESSYKPFQLKVIASSKINQNPAFNIGPVYGQSQGASAKRLYDHFPRFVKAE